MDEETTVYVWATLAAYNDEALRHSVERTQEYVALQDARAKSWGNVVVRATGPARHAWIKPNGFNVPLGVDVIGNPYGHVLLQTVLPVRRYDDAWFEAAESGVSDGQTVPAR